jgi:hypothetical protein
MVVDLTLVQRNVEAAVWCTGAGEFLPSMILLGRLTILRSEDCLRRHWKDHKKECKLWKAFDPAVAFSAEAIAANPMLFCGLDVCHSTREEIMTCFIDLYKNAPSSDPEANCVSCDWRMCGAISINVTQDITSIITLNKGLVQTDALASEFEEKRRVSMCHSCTAVYMAAYNFLGGSASVEDAIQGTRDIVLDYMQNGACQNKC